MQISSSYLEESKDNELNLSAQVVDHRKRDEEMKKKFQAPKENYLI
jgi:hypothetical protein